MTKSGTAQRQDTQRRGEDGGAEAPTSVADVKAYYKQVGKEETLQAPYFLPGEFTRGLGEAVPALPEAPIIVLINSESGGRAGPACTSALRHALGYNQVFDLGKHRPDQVLEAIWKNFSEHEASDPERVRELRDRLRIVVAGGDGTVGWTLQTVKRSGIDPHPAVGIIPLGTGNDMARTFRWGATFDKTWIKNHDELHKTLRMMADAKPTPLDRWQLVLKGPSPKYFQKKRPPTFTTLHDDVNKDEATEFKALSWNYFSIGMDAKTVYGFDRLREKKPFLAPGGAINKFWYGFFCFSSGWFVGKGAKLPHKLHLEVQDSKGNWEEQEVPKEVSALVFLNNQSYAGGNDLWRHDDKAEQQGFKKPTYNDGLIEVVGFRSGYHAGAVLFKTMSCMRIAQAAGARVRASGLGPDDDEGSVVYMQLDGEPWEQDVPNGEACIEMTFTNDGQSNMLMAPGKGR